MGLERRESNEGAEMGREVERRPADQGKRGGDERI